MVDRKSPAATNDPTLNAASIKKVGFADNIDSNIPHADGCFPLGISNKELNVRIGLL